MCLVWRVPGGLWDVWLRPRQTQPAPPSRVQMSGLLLHSVWDDVHNNHVMGGMHRVLLCGI